MKETSQKFNTFVVAFIVVNLVTCFLFVLPTFGDENEGWKEVRNKKGIRVLTRVVEGNPIKQAWAETIIDAPIEVLFEIVATPETWTNWYAFCAEHKALKKIDENSLVGYFVAGLPFPFRDRDMIWLMKLKKNFEEGTGLIEIEKIPDSEDDPYGMDGVTKEKRRVRAGDMFGTCEMTRVDKNKTKVVYIAAADPNLPLPTWFLNWFAAIQPVMAIKGFTKEAKKEVYYERAGVVHNKKIAGNT
jgi:hypothetical protein